MVLSRRLRSEQESYSRGFKASFSPNITLARNYKSSKKRYLEFEPTDLDTNLAQRNGIFSLAPNFCRLIGSLLLVAILLY